MLATAAIAQPGRFGFGTPATPGQIAGWDIDVRPDGKGLPPGKGTVAEGQVLYDAQCASCHGTFGESNDYMVIAGGIGTLGSAQPMRTTGSKLNHATTLWDYINRAMPFGNPKSLSADQVYALTAYVLHLNELLPADGALDRESIVKVRMPNRDGFTLDHGLASVRGTPDTRNVACMRDCAREVRLSSELPEHALGAHGNLAEQTRSIGGNSEKKVASAPARAPATDPRADLARTSGCTACHGMTQKVVGPAFRDIAARYAKDAGAVEHLAQRVKAGGTGIWGQVPMPPQPQLQDGEAKALVQWILAGPR
jgi:cytochrome c